MSTYYDIGGGYFFFVPSSCVPPWFPPWFTSEALLVCWALGKGVKRDAVPFRRQLPQWLPQRLPQWLPPPCEFLWSLLFPYVPHLEIEHLGQGSETTASPKPFREASGVERGVSPFLLRENLRENTGLLTETLLVGMSFFLFLLIYPLLYTYSTESIYSQ